MNWSNLLLSFDGRINRKTYLLGLLPVLALFTLLYGYIVYLSAGQSATVSALIMAVLGLTTLYFFTSLSIKRLNDVGRPIWFLGLLYSPLIVAIIFLFQQKFLKMEKHEAAVLIYTILIVLAVIAFFWILVEMMFRRAKEEVEAEMEAANTSQND